VASLCFYFEFLYHPAGVYSAYVPLLVVC
jgi:hypothetical protein